MKNDEIFGLLIAAKLNLAQKAITLLPADIQPKVKEVEKTVLTILHDQLGRYLQQEKQGEADNGLKKVEVD